MRGDTMTQPTEGGAIPEIPRTFADVYDDVRLVEESTKMIEVFRRCVDNILFSNVDKGTKRKLMLQSIEEFFEEIEEGLEGRGE
jgi:hypothetical protein